MKTHANNINLSSKNYYRLLFQVYKEVGQSKTLEEALTIFMDLTTATIGCERGSVFIYDKRANELYTYVAQGNLQRQIRVAEGIGFVGWSFSHDESLYIDDVNKDDRYNNSIDKITGFKTKSVLCVPLKNIHNELIGVIQLLNKIEDVFNDHDVKIVQEFTEQASLAIQSRLSIESIENRHQNELEFLNVISKVSTEINLSSLLELIINFITKVLEAERATLFVNDSKTNELYTRTSIGLEESEIRFQNNLGIAGSVFKTGKIINIPHAYADLRFNPSVDKATGFFTRSMLTAPVVNKQGNVIGITQVLNKKHGTFTSEDEVQLVAITTQISMAIENAKLFDDVQNIKNYNESILESMTNGVITLNESNKIVTCNNPGLRLLGLNNLSEIINQDVKVFFNNSNQALQEKIEKMITSTDVSMQETLIDTEIILPNHKLTANISIVPLYNLMQERLGNMIIIEDISSEKRMKSTMSRYMSPDLAEKLLESSDFSLGGTSTVATVLFSDIRNFTSISELLGPEETVSILNQYFTLMVDSIQNEEGTLDKFIGDAIMAVFGTPFAHEDDPDRAVRAAIAMMKALTEFNKSRLGKNTFQIYHGIGINTDQVLSGNIGSEKRMDFTVIGDGVNLASRIEGLCKIYGAGILISEFTLHQLKATYRLRQIDKVVVKGKAKPVSIYEVLDFYSEETFPNQIEVLEQFKNGIAYYHKMQWTKAINCFLMALQLNPNDKPSQVYLDRCNQLKINPPQGDWDGVWIMDRKS